MIPIRFLILTLTLMIRNQLMMIPIHKILKSLMILKKCHVMMPISTLFPTQILMNASRL